MSLPKMTTPVNNISLLDDLPNAVGGLSAAELKARFDKAGGDIQTFLNETLIPAIEQMGVAEGTARDEAIQAAIDALELDTTVENLQKAIVAAESRAKEYADTKDAANLAAAKQYADGEAAAAASAAVNAAAADATSKANAALSNAKSYTDDKAAAVLAEAALVSGSDAQNAETAAKQYADKQDAATLTAAKEYTDGKIPSKLPNPQKLKFTGAVSGEYDGSEEKTINIPSGGSADLPPVLGNFNAAMQDAAAGSIPVYAGDEAWEIEKIIKDYTGDKDLFGYIPATEWVAAYLSKNTVQRVDRWAGENGIASLAKNMPIGVCDGKVGNVPSGMQFPVLLFFAQQAYGNVSYTGIDNIGVVWAGGISLSDYTVTATKKAAPLPTSTAADAGKLLQVGADGAAAWGSKLPTALKNPAALTFAGAVTGTYDGSAPLTITIPEGGSGGSTGGGLRKMSAVSSYIGIPVAELPQDGTVWMCISKGDGAELYSGTVTIEGGSLTANNLIAVSGGTTAQLNQATTIGAGFVIYGMSATSYTGVWQQVGAGGASINWRGEWAEATLYSKLDAVSYEGSSYIFASDTPATGAIPGVDGEWQMMAQKGDSGTDLSLGVTGATVGQIAKITAVDASGKPTAWAPVDMPSGGGSNWVKVHEETLAEPLESYIYQLDSVRAAAIVIAPGSDIEAGWKRIKLNTMDIPIASDKIGVYAGLAVCIDLDAPIKMIANNNSTVKGITSYGPCSNVRGAITAGDIDTINQIGIITNSLLIAGSKISIYTK